MLVLFFWLCVAAVVYTYAGYPLLLFLAGRLRPQRRLPAAELPHVTLLIAAYNEEDVIADKLEHSLQLDYPREKLQILVAADGSDDATPDIVRRYKDRGVDLSYSPPRRGKMAAITNALAQARGSVVIITDANNEYNKESLRLLVAPYADPKVGAVGGAKHIVQDGAGLSASEGLYWRYESFIKQQESRLGSCVAMPGEILSFRRELFEPPQRPVIMDDIYVAMLILRKGYRIAYEPRAKSYEYVSPTAQDEFERRARNVAGRYQAAMMLPAKLFWRRPVVMWQWMSHKFMRMLLPFAMLGALVTNILLVVWPPEPSATWDWVGMSPPYGWIVLVLQILFYLLAWIGSRVQVGGVIGKLLYLPSFLVSSNMAGLAGFLRHVTRRQAATWRRVTRLRH